MKIAIVGPGAMGCLFAAFLARVKESRVLMIDKRPDRARYLARRGLKLSGLTRARVKGVPVTCDARLAGTCDVVLFFVKAYDTGEAAKRVRRCVGENTVAATFQNGLGNLETIRRAFPRSATVLAGVTAQGATALGRGESRHAGTGDTTVGWDDARQAGHARSLAGVLSRAGIRARAEKGMKSLLWAKLVLNSAINPLGTVLGMRNGELAANSSSRALLCAAAEESAGVARAAGVSIAPGAAGRAAVAVCRATAGNLNSMLQDFRHGRPNEVDQINGAIVRCAGRLGRETPINKAFLRALRPAIS